MENGILELVNFYIKIGGLPLVFLIIFLETGLFLGFFLPGDSLLFALGIIAAAKIVDLNLTLWGCTIASILGNYVAYFLGYSIINYFGNSYKGNFINKYSKHLEKTREFYNKYGLMAILYARFIPFFRGFIPFLAGMIKMNLAIFSFYNILSAFVWVWSLVLLGYFLGNLIPKNFVALAILAVIVISLIPLVYKFLKDDTRKSLNKV